MKKIISTDKAPQAIGPYSQAVIAGNLIFVSGQIALEATGVAEQTRQALLNLKAILEAAGSNLNQVVKTTVFLKNMADFSTMNNIYAEYFNENPPARSTVEVARLPKEVLFEIEAIAQIESAK